MESREPILDVEEDEEEDDDTSDSTDSEESSTSTSESEGEANVSFILVDEEEHEKVQNIFGVQDGEDLNPCEELMKPKVEPKVKQEIITKMVSPDLNAGERQQYMQMLAKFPNLFITSYEEIRGFQGEDLRIELKEDAKPVPQKLRRMWKEQM